MPDVDRLLFIVTLLAALGCGLIAGVFFAFSTFVMKALARLPTSHGIAAMQSTLQLHKNPRESSGNGVEYRVAANL